MTRRCADCEWWQGRHDSLSFGMEVERGECRGAPPSAGKDAAAVWPHTPRYEWCAAFERAEELVA